MSVMWGMPGGKRAEQYLICRESFWIGMRYFEKGAHVARDDPLADKSLRECPDFVWSVDLKELDNGKQA
jgi:hypothetical protein